MTVALVILVFVLGAIAIAYIDGGREDLRQITQPIPLPETVS